MEIPFTCADGPSEVYGMLHRPEKQAPRAADDLCVVIMNSWLTHRVGPHRFSVRLARRLAERGVNSLRFDFSGIGNSPVRSDGLALKDQWYAEALEVMAFLKREHGFRRFVFVGICAGGVLSFGISYRDHRIAGAVLINTRDYELDSNWKEFALQNREFRFYWKRAIFRPASWARLLRGRSSVRTILGALIFRSRQALKPSTTLESARRWFKEHLDLILGRGVRLLYVFSEGDPGRDHLRLLHNDALADGQSTDMIEVAIIAQADHTFTIRSCQTEVLDKVTDWISTLSEGPDRRVMKPADPAVA